MSGDTWYMRWPDTDMHTLTESHNVPNTSHNEYVGLYGMSSHILTAQPKAFALLVMQPYTCSTAQPKATYINVANIAITSMSHCETINQPRYSSAAVPCHQTTGQLF